MWDHSSTSGDWKGEERHSCSCGVSYCTAEARACKNTTMRHCNQTEFALTEQSVDLDSNLHPPRHVAGSKVDALPKHASNHFADMYSYDEAPTTHTEQRPRASCDPYARCRMLQSREENSQY